MRRFLSKRPQDVRYCIVVGLAIGVSQAVFRDTMSHFGFFVGLIAAGTSAGVIAAIFALIWPVRKNASPEAIAAGK
jgi:hypothetical protein